MTCISCSLPSVWGPLCKIRWNLFLSGDNFPWKAWAVCTVFSMLVQLGAGFTWGSPQEAVAAPQLHRGQRSKQFPTGTRGGCCEWRWTLFVPLRCPASNRQSSSGANGSLGSAGSAGQLQELATGCAGMGCSVGEDLLQDAFQRVRGGEGCRCLGKQLF